MKQTIAYMRVSTKAQKEGNGLAQQRASIIAYAAMHGKTIDDWAEDAESGTLESREEMDRLKTMAEAGTLGCILVDRMDRLGRTAQVTLNLDGFMKEHGVEVICCTQAFDEKTPFGAFQKLLYIGLAEYDRALLLCRMKQCKRAALQNGRFIGGGAPYGYRVSNVPGELQPEPSEAETVRKIFDMKQRGMSSVAIARSLNEAGVPSPKGAKWWNATVLDIYKRGDFYRGLTTLHLSKVGQVAPIHEAIL
jgi:site-specific DNA recombinase